MLIRNSTDESSSTQTVVSFFQRRKAKLPLVTSRKLLRARPAPLVKKAAAASNGSP